MIQVQTTTTIDDTIKRHYNIMTPWFEDGSGKVVSADYLYDQYKKAIEAIGELQERIEALEEKAHWMNK